MSIHPHEALQTEIAALKSANSEMLAAHAQRKARIEELQTEKVAWQKVRAALVAVRETLRKERNDLTEARNRALEQCRQARLKNETLMAQLGERRKDSAGRKHSELLLMQFLEVQEELERVQADVLRVNGRFAEKKTAG